MVSPLLVSSLLFSLFASFPSYATRREVKADNIAFIQDSGICETTPGVHQASGYINVTPEDRMWFWFFESRIAPQMAPLTLWLNGGPGCSSMIGLFQELGPCTVNEDGASTSINQYSWNTVSNMLFIDQPILSGFSFGTANVSRVEQAAGDVWVALQAFFSTDEFAFLRYRPFFIATESFGGHYGPTFAEYFSVQNAMIDRGEIEGVSINVAGLAISNGKHDPLIQMKSAPAFSKNAPGYGPLIPSKTVMKVKESWESVCKPQMEECYDEDEDEVCRQAIIDCTNEVLIPSAGSRSLNDLLQDADQDSSDKFPPTYYLRYIRNETVKEAIGADTRFDQCAATVKFYFARAGETGRSALPPLSKLANWGLPLLIWAGDTDLKSNWLGVHDSMVALDWYGGQRLKDMEYTNMTIRGVDVAAYKVVDNLTFVRVFGAGHAMPAYQPEVALTIFSQFLRRERIHSV